MKIFSSFFNSVSSTLGRIVAYLIIGVIVALLMGSCEVKALDMGIPTLTYNYIPGSIYDPSSVSRKAEVQLWWDEEFYTLTTEYLGNPGSTSRIGTQFISDWPTANLCVGQSILITGYVGGLFGFYDNSYTFKAYNASAEMTCSTELIDSSKLKYTCSGVGGGGFMISLNQNTFKPVTNYAMGVSKVVNISCDNTNSDIITNANNNTNNIINNQNNNTNTIINNNNANTDREIENDNKNHEEAEKTRQGILGTLQNVFTSITELPGKLVNLITDSLKSLFIPTDEHIEDILNKSSNVATSFGFIGQSADFFINMFTSFLDITQGKGCVTLPELTIEFSKMKNLKLKDYTIWEEQNVCIADNEWMSNETVISTIRLITTLGFLILFLNLGYREFNNIFNQDIPSGVGS